MTTEVAAKPGQASVLLSAEGITKVFGSTIALQNVSIVVHEGEVHALVGENGAGKSTLLKIVVGVEVPTEGSIRLDGRTYQNLTPVLARDLGINMVPQHLELCEELSVADNMFLGRWPTRRGTIDRRTMHRDTERILAHVGLDLDPETPIRDLRYVYKQMVEIARVSEFFSPRLIAFDEPTAALSAREIEILFGLIERLRASGVGIIYVSHYLPEVAAVADRVTILRDGRVVASAEVSSLSIEEIVHLMVGDVPDLYRRDQTVIGDALLSIAHVRTSLLDDVTLQVRAGEIVGIAASKGEGVTELLQSLCRVAGKPLAGDIRWKGKPLQLANSGDALAHGIGYLSEDRQGWGLFHGRSIRDNLTISSLRKYLNAVGGIRTQQEKAGATAMLNRFVIKAPGLEEPIETLSGGNQQKVLLARLLGGPDLSLYVIDNPTFGVDVRSRAEIHSMLNRAVAAGAGVLMYTSDLVELLEMSDRIYLVKNGRVVREFYRGEVSANELQERLIAGGDTG